ncbi:hypothetical protein EVAR_59949_1 [Eumeta japonica]|uniref:Uncharacterized protein n=1 Tax=Eumeta variegata TaxID=151549 RepID=A0A4C1YS78_EUMVA|nr:hypothetical protein EVAR_59949_1 [Eumeta japonica]
MEISEVVTGSTSESQANFDPSKYGVFAMVKVGEKRLQLNSQIGISSTTGIQPIEIWIENNLQWNWNHNQMKTKWEPELQPNEKREDRERKKTKKMENGAK